MNQCPRWDRLMKKIGRQKSRGTIPLSVPKINFGGVRCRGEQKLVPLQT
jgi:hypothetical protein